MQLYRVTRFATGSHDTIGMLSRYDDVPGAWSFLCFTLEDPKQTVKIKGRTRIPAGTYRLTLRTEGGFHERYSKKFPDMHKGMIWVRDIPEFEYVLFHIGNTHIDTEGCLLLGNGVKYTGGPSELLHSTYAYRSVYPGIRNSILAGPTSVQYVDFA